MGPSGRFTLVGIILHCLGQVYADFVFGQKRAGRGGAAEARGARGRQAGASGECAAGHWARAGCRRAACAHLGVLAGLWAVHLVHSACFSPSFDSVVFLSQFLGEILL